MKSRSGTDFATASKRCGNTGYMVCDARAPPLFAYSYVTLSTGKLYGGSFGVERLPNRCSLAVLNTVPLLYRAI